jgi:hypothetical protein
MTSATEHALRVLASRAVHELRTAAAILANDGAPDIATSARIGDLVIDEVKGGDSSRVRAWLAALERTIRCN